MPIEVLHLGMKTTHDEGFIYSRPRGVGAWVLMYLPIPLEIDTLLGREQSRPGDCILHDPDFTQMHRSLSGGFHNDWMHFNGRRVKAIVREGRLPVNRLIRVQSMEFIHSAMFALKREMVQTPLHWQRRCSLLATDLLWQLSRAVNRADNEPRTRSESDHYPHFVELRSQIASQFRRQWTIDDMADQLNLSYARFSALYRRFFDISPNDDLIRIRIEHAKVLLANTGMSIKEVAADSGFSNIYYFSRLFRRRMGCPPRHYMRRSA